MWSYKYKYSNIDSVDPLNSLIDITVQFSSGEKTFTKTYNVNILQYKTPEDIEELVASDLAVLDAKEEIKLALIKSEEKTFPKKITEEVNEIEVSK